MLRRLVTEGRGVCSSACRRRLLATGNRSHAGTLGSRTNHVATTLWNGTDPRHSHRFSTFSTSSTPWTPSTSPATVPRLDVSRPRDESDAELRHLARTLASYRSLKIAVVERGEDFSPNPRFSQNILRDVLRIARDTPANLHPQQLVQIVTTLLLPTTNITIPSHAVAALLEVVVLSLNKSKTIKRLDYAHAEAAREVLENVRTIQIYYTSDFSQQEMDGWNNSLTTILNIVLNFYATIASKVSLETSKAASQTAENLVADSALTARPVAREFLNLKPDVISFNTIINAWANTAEAGSRLSLNDESTYQQGLKAAEMAAERAQAVLSMMVEISQQVPTLQPTPHSYGNTLQAWSFVRKVTTPQHVFDTILHPMVHRCLENNGPFPNVFVLSTACKSLRCHTQLSNFRRHLDQLLEIQANFNIHMSTIFCNGILTAFHRMEPRNRAEYAYKMEDMVSFFDAYCQEPDRISYMTVLAGIRDAVLKSEKANDRAIAHAKRILQQAGRFRDHIMHLDVMEALHFHPNEAEEFLSSMGERADYAMYRSLIETYERAACSQSPGTTEYGEKAEALLREMELISEMDRSFRPTSHVYNSVIIAWLAANDIVGVERADSVLQNLLERYQRRLRETMEGDGSEWINERPNSTSFAIILSGYARHGSIQHIEKMEQILQQMGDLELAWAHASHALKNRFAMVEVNVLVANHLLNMYANFSGEDDGLLARAENLLKRMGTVGFKTKPDEYSYTILFKAYANSNASAGRTMRLIELAKLNKYRFDLRMYNSALNALASSGSLEGANAASALLEDMQKANVNPDTFSFSAVIKAYCSLNTVEGVKRADAYFCQALAAGQADVVCCLIMTKAYRSLNSFEGTARANEIAGLQRYLSLSPMDSTNVDSGSFDPPGGEQTADSFHTKLLTMVEQFEQSGRQEDDGSLHRAFGVGFSNWFYDQTIASAAKTEDLFRLRLKLFHDKKMHAPTKLEIESTIKKLGHCQQIEIAEELLEDVYLHAMGKDTISEAAYDAIMHAYLREPPKVESAIKACKILEKMRERHKNGALAEPGSTSYLNCINAWVRTASPDCDERAEELLRQMELVVPTHDPNLARAYNLVLKACAICSYKSKDSIRRGTDIFGDLMKLNIMALPPSYAYMLQIASRIPGSQQRVVGIYDKVIRQCRKCGCVSEFVLKEFLQVAPTDLARSVFNVEDPKKLRWADLPADWKQNVRSSRRE